MRGSGEGEGVSGQNEGGGNCGDGDVFQTCLKEFFIFLWRFSELFCLGHAAMPSNFGYFRERRFLVLDGGSILAPATTGFAGA